MNIEVTVPDGQSGPWRIETKIVEDPDLLSKARAIVHGYGRYVPAGTYKILYRDREVIMSNTPDEIRDFMYFIHKARGRVLVNGLGLGVVLKALIEKPEVDFVTVIELSEDVIKLVGPTFENHPKVEIIHADAYTYQPPKGVRYNAVWHDIWDEIGSENLEGMSKLHRKYGSKTDYQDSWAKDLCQKMRKEEREWQKCTNFFHSSNLFDHLDKLI